MRQPAPVGPARLEGAADQLPAGGDVPQAEFDPDIAVGTVKDPAGDQRFGADALPVVETRREHLRPVALDEGLRVDRAEQAGASQVVGDDAGDLLGGRPFFAGGRLGHHDGDGQRLEVRIVDPNGQLCGGRRGDRDGDKARQEQPAAQPEHRRGRKHRYPVLNLDGSKSIVSTFQWSYFFGGSLSGLHWGIVDSAESRFGSSAQS